jgi:predicted transcriptional regulator
MTTEANPTEAPAEGGGRPRPQDTIARDGKVKQLLVDSGPLTRAQIAEKMGITPSLAYLSLFRLSKRGEVRRVLADSGKSHTWEIVPTAPTV